MIRKDIEKIILEHKSWLESNGKEGSRADFSNTDLRQGMLTRLQLREAKLIRANLQKADASDTNFQKANLQEANLEYSNLQNSDLSNSNLQKANLYKANLRNSILKNADLRNANLSEADLSNSSLEKILIYNTNFDGTVLDGAHINQELLNQFPNTVLSKYSLAFFQFDDSTLSQPSTTILRSIEFPPQYLQAGISVLNYFGTVLRKKYPDQKAKVKIEQDGLKVTMTVETIKGDTEVIEHALNEYGLVLTGEMSPEEYTTDRALIMDLKHELRMASVRIEAQKDIIDFQKVTLREFESLLNVAIKKPTSLSITSNSLKDTLQKDNVIHNIPIIYGGLNELLEQSPEGSEEYEEILNLQKSLDRIEKSSSPEEVAKSSAMSKLERFLENVEKKESAAGKVIKTTKDGIDIARKLAGHYNTVAQWCGLPQVPVPFVTKQ